MVLCQPVAVEHSGRWPAELRVGSLGAAELGRGLREGVLALGSTSVRGRVWAAWL